MSGLRLVPLLLALIAGTASADPLALRHGGPAPAVVVDAGWPTASVGAWLGPRTGFAVDLRLPASAVGVAMGTRHTRSDGPKHGGVDVFVAGGVLVPTLEPGVALTATPAIQAGHRGERAHVTVGLAAPIEALLVPRAAIRAPALLELRLGGNLGPLWLGVRGALGAVFASGSPPGFTVGWSLWLRIPAQPS